MLSCGKILPAPVEIVCLLRAELVIVTEFFNVMPFLQQ